MGKKSRENFSKNIKSYEKKKIKKMVQWRINAYRIEVGLFGGNAGLMLPFKPYGVRGVNGKAGVSGRGDPANDVSGSVSDRYDENDSSRTYSMDWIFKIIISSKVYIFESKWVNLFLIE